jgi:putative transposase
MKTPPDPHYRHRYLAEVISHAVWLYHVFSLSLRDVELLLAERGVVVSYETVRRWCKKFGQSFADRMRDRRPRPGDKWYLDEVFVRIQGVQHYLWRAVDQNGVVLVGCYASPSPELGGCHGIPTSSSPGSARSTWWTD